MGGRAGQGRLCKAGFPPWHRIELDVAPGAVRWMIYLHERVIESSRSRLMDCISIVNPTSNLSKTIPVSDISSSCGRVAILFPKYRR